MSDYAASVACLGMRGCLVQLSGFVALQAVNGLCHSAVKHMAHAVWSYRGLGKCFEKLHTVVQEK